MLPLFCLNAQELTDNPKAENRKIIDFSLDYGLNFSWLSGDIDEFEALISSATGFDFDEKWRIFNVPVGVSVTANATSWLSFKTGAMFSPRGMKFVDKPEIGGDDYYVRVVLKLRYIDVPCLAELNLTTNRQTTLFLSGGLVPSFLVDSKLVTKVSGPSDSDKESEDWTDVNQFDLGFQVGAGTKIKSGYYKVQYVMGLKNVSSADWSFTNNTISLIFGTYF